MKRLKSKIHGKTTGEFILMVINFIKNRSGLFDSIYKRKKYLSNKIDSEFDSTVMYGPFKGFKFCKKSWWSNADRGSMLLGLYEQEVLNSLFDTPQEYINFIDLGAADGYYGVGVLKSGKFKRSICFEISEQGREVIKSNAILNGVFDNIEIHGIANKNFFTEIQSIDLSKTVLFVDIEGGEFDLLDKAVLSAFSKSIVFVEIHEWFVNDGDNRLKKFTEDAAEFFKITILTTESRDLSKYPMLSNFNDTDRWLLCSEGRERLMKWYRLDPK